MKSIPLLSLLFATLIMASCQQGTVSVESDSTENNQQTAGTKPAIPDSVKLPYALAKRYVDNYAKHAGFIDADAVDSTGRKPSKPDTRSIWFSKERLVQIVAELEDEHGDGIRFYLMTYDDHYPADRKHKGPPPPPKDYWGYNSLIMVSTKDSTTNGNVYHRDYYTGSDGPVAESKSKHHGFIVGFAPENRGELCPPPVDCFMTGALLLKK